MIIAMVAVAASLLGAGDGIVNTFGNPIPGVYIVRFTDAYQGPAAAELAQSLQTTYGGLLRSVYEGPVPGAVFERWSEAVALRVARDRRVEFLDQDCHLTLDSTQALRAAGDQDPSLDRIDQRENAPDYRFRRIHDGSGVTIYIVDTGISTTGTSFASRVSTTTGFLAMGVSGTFLDDTAGHGTAMASVAAASVVGTAKFATLISVRVTSSTPNLTRVEDGLRWILAQAAPGVVNISLEFFTTSVVGTTTIEQLLAQLKAAGYTVVASAGNTVQDTANILPSRSPDVVTVGAMSVSNHQPWVDVGAGKGSSFGAAIDLYAPGANVRFETTNGAISLGAGTSPAAALTSGAIAALLESQQLTPAAVLSKLTSTAEERMCSSRDLRP